MHTGTTNAGKSRTPARSAGGAAQAAKRPLLPPAQVRTRELCAARRNPPPRRCERLRARRSARKRRFGRSMATGGGQRP